MAKKKENSLNNNFEALKAQMQAKRKKAENRFEMNKSDNEFEKENSEPIVTISEDESVNVDTVNDIENVTDEDNSSQEEYVTLNIIENDEDEFDNYNNEFKDKDCTQVEYIAKKTGVVSDININKIVIKKVEKPEMPKRITYYLKPETIKKIDKFSKASGMGKSEFVQKILDEVLNNLEIQK